jgi:DNA processing protein
VDEVLEAIRVSPIGAMPSTARPAVPTEIECTKLLARLGHDALDADTLLVQTGLSVGELSMGLLALEMAGMIERLPGGKVQRVFA